DVKRVVIEMEAHNKCITVKAKTNYNLYTLFAILILEDISARTYIELAETYSSFMDLVDIFRSAEDAEQLYSGEKPISENWENAFKYYQGTRGANTDLPQRKDRYDSLKSVLIGYEDN